MSRDYYFVEYNARDTALILAENGEEALNILFKTIREEHENDPTRLRYNPPHTISLRKIASEGAVLEASK